MAVDESEEGSSCGAGEEREAREILSDSEEEHNIPHAEDWAAAGAKICSVESLKMLPG